MHSTLPLLDAPLRVDFSDGSLAGRSVVEVKRTIADLAGVFASEPARAALNPTTLAYRVQTCSPAPEGTVGGLFYGVTLLEPGLVGDEFFMTRGHFHSKAEAAEYYWCIRGQGILLLMDRDRRCQAQRMTPGSLHYIPGFTAHRTVNTGDTTLCFGACWPADAGHDYASIARDGFSARVLRIDGTPTVVKA